MDLLSSIESRIEKVMSRLFSGRKGEERVQPVMIAQELVKAMESARHVSVEAVYVPNHFQVRLHPLDHQAIQPVQYTVTRDCVAYLSKVAQRRRLSFAGPVTVEMIADPSVPRGVPSVAASFREEQQAVAGVEAETSRYVLARGRVAVDQDVDGGTRRFRRSELQFAGVAPSRLEVINGHEPATLVLTPGQTYLVGRADESDLQLRDSRVSRRHARLLYQDESWWIEDLQTTNGTRLNGVPIRRERLRDGDEITVGLTTIRFVERS
ncbi:MAG TPA: DUF3662 and FHA domain-containing protein [Limnochordia bacterium]|nr:DUF3662 and FHA domain-containing protein [Limnochordia bacterium]